MEHINREEKEIEEPLDADTEIATTKDREYSDGQQRHCPAVQTMVKELPQWPTRVRPTSLLAIGAIWIGEANAVVHCERSDSVFW